MKCDSLLTKIKGRASLEDNSWLPSGYVHACLAPLQRGWSLHSFKLLSPNITDHLNKGSQSMLLGDQWQLVPTIEKLALYHRKCGREFEFVIILNGH